MTQQVSKLLATIYVLSASTEFFPLSPSCKALSENHWASYFHQASLGTHLNYQFFSNMIGRCKVQHPVDAEVCSQASLFAYPFLIIGPTASFVNLPLSLTFMFTGFPICILLFLIIIIIVFLLFWSIFRKHIVADSLGHTSLNCMWWVFLLILHDKK